MSFFLGPAEGYGVSTALLVRVLGFIYALAFASLLPQLRGLVGREGILPAGAFLALARERLGTEAFRWLPTLFWLGASDRVLLLAGGAGVLLGLLVLAGFLPAPSLLVLWALYLSFATIGRDFLAFQWDNLLLEAGFLGVLAAPWTFRRREGPPPRLVYALLLCLLFRLMVSSGAVKLLSGDETWRSLRALTVHYETQPLPTPAGWLFHQLPAPFQIFSCGVMFAVELLVPWLILIPRLRRFAFPPLVGLQALIALTGNYAFFNVLTIALCLPLLPDSSFPRRLRAAQRHQARSAPGWILGPVALLLALLAAVELLGTLGLIRGWPAPVAALARIAAPFRTVSGYGLFAVMTTERREIRVEGSRDGATWIPYEFRFKPGDPRRGPPVVAPYQPRVDWQMWFAALGPFEQSPWFLSFVRRLLQGSPSVLSLLGKNPFPDAPPRYIRAVLSDYTFTDARTFLHDGTWWRVRDEGLFLPALSLESFGER